MPRRIGGRDAGSLRKARRTGEAPAAPVFIDGKKAVTLPCDTPVQLVPRERRLVSAVIWLSSVCPDGQPHLVPIWFSWDGEALLIASKPNAMQCRA